MESAALQFPWRQLGELLVAEGLLTEDELEQALAEQATTGRLLGQILVANSYLSAFSLARVLSEQHGVELSRKEGVSAPPAPSVSQPEQTWRPLGKLLVDLEFLTESQLERALAEQHGVELAAQDEAELQTVVRPITSEEPMYKLFEVIFEPGYQRRTELFESTNFLETADYAFEFVDDHEPAALEIHRTHGAAEETVWNYSASRAAAVSEERKDLAQTFGFDPTVWGKKR